MTEPIRSESTSLLQDGRLHTIPIGRREAGSTVRPKLKFSINQITTYRWSFEEDVRNYESAAIDAIGVWRSKLDNFEDYDDIDILQDSDLAVSSISWAGGFTGTNGYSYKEAVADAFDSLYVASQLNADCLVVASGPRSGHTVNHSRRLFIDALKELADAAAVLEVDLCIQPMRPRFAQNWTFINTLDQAMEIIDAVDHRSVKLAFDVYQLWQEENLLGRLPGLIPDIGLVQLSDWREPTRSDTDRCMIGDGCIPLDMILDCLADHDYSGYCELQIWSDELWQSDYNQLIELGQDRFEQLCDRSAVLVD